MASVSDDFTQKTEIDVNKKDDDTENRHDKVVNNDNDGTENTADGTEVYEECTDKWVKGVCKWFSHAKGWGFINIGKFKKKKIQCIVSNRRFFKIDKHLARHFVYYVECFSSPRPFLCSQIINFFLIQ